MALTFDDTQTAALLKLLGLPADTTDAELIVDTCKDMRAQLDGMNPEQPSTVAAAAKRHGMELVDAESITALRRDAAEGRQIKAAAVQAKIEASVDEAVTKGKITQSRRKHWVTLIAADPGMADVLAAVPNETAVPLTEIGHGVDNEGGPLTAEWFR